MRGKKLFVASLFMGIGAVFAACPVGAGRAEAAVMVAPNDAHLQYFGRWDKSNAQEYQCAQGAVYIKANFTGTSIKAKLRDPNDKWRVSIDGGAFQKIKPRGNETVFAENLKPGTHKLLFVRSTEGYMGTTQFRGFELDDGARLEAPDPLKTRRLEFVGDSITAGAKNDGELKGENYNDIEDNDQAYGPKVSRMLDADYSIVAKSGEGVVHNWADPWPSHQVHTADRYVWTMYSDRKEGSHPRWDAKQFPVDATIVAMGTNDFSKPAKHSPTKEEFVAGYVNLIETIRAVNPGKKIICTEPVPNWGGKRGRAWVRAAVDQVTAEGMKDVYFIAINDPQPLLAESDYAHDSTHPLQTGHQKIAAYLKDKIAAIMGWN